MKVGILTFHNAHNFGATLQAYALKTCVSKMGHEVKIINYRNPRIEGQYPKRLAPKFTIRQLHPKHVKQYAYDTLRGIYGQKAWKRQWQAFDQFIREQLLDGDDTRITPDMLPALGMDAYLLGSDQIWSGFLLGELDPVYFGGFKTNEKMISYAASLANGIIPEEEHEQFAQLLQNVDVISVREERLAEEVHKIADRDAEVTIDPTLLLESQDYDIILNPESRLPHPLPDKPYIFAYFVVEEQAVADCARKLAQDTGLPVVELHYYHMPECSEPNQYADFGPGDFLTYAKNAEYVVTNSFHGTVFSIIFERKFYSVYKKNGRVDNLLGFLQIPRRHVENAEQLPAQQEEIDYQAVSARLANYREASLQFLNRNLD